MSYKRSSMDLMPESPALETSKSTSRKRLNLDLSPSAYELLRKLSEETDKNMADVLRTGLALYGIAHESHANGKSIGIIEGENVLKEIVIT